jgi:DNA-directed RNA polymerase subunit M/transcription elongation factor TFIIS
MIRARALNAFSAHLDAGHAADLEHGCFCASALNGAPYSRFVYRALYALEQQSALASVIRESGALAALALSDTSLYEHCSTREQAAATKARHADCTQMLANLSADDPSADLPEKGIKCARCGSTNIIPAFSQTRSADEGTTVFCYCTACSKRWKM